MVSWTFPSPLLPQWLKSSRIQLPWAEGFAEILAVSPQQLQVPAIEGRIKQPWEGLGNAL